MDGVIRTTYSANQLIASRRELALCLRTGVDTIAGIVARPADFYTEFSIPKKGGGERTIRPPLRVLRALQRTLLERICDRVRLRSCLHGSIRGRSIITHASAHVGREMVATLDIRKFFPSTTEAHVAPVLMAVGFRGNALEDALQLVLLDGRLPEGAPTSPLLANLAFSGGDNRFIRICRRLHLEYSRYVDDIAVSGDYDFHDLRGPFVDAIVASGYTVAEEKIRFAPGSRRQVITGLTVNQQLRPTKAFVASLKEDIRLCLDMGAATVADIHGLAVPKLKAQLSGRVAHVRHVDSKLGSRLRGMLCGIDWRSTPRAPISL